MTVILSLFLLLPFGAFSFENVPESNAALPIDASTQMTSFNKPGNSPCHCKASSGPGCTVSISAGLVTGSISFHPPCRSRFSALLEIALVGNSDPVPLPPPKV